MTESTDKVWAIDRRTGKTGRYEPAFLDAWPSDYLRIDPPKTKRQPDRAASTPPASGDNPEGGA